MAQRIHVELVDDIDQTPAVETVTFGLDGVQYKIDLSEQNAAALREALAPYIGHGERVAGSGRRRSGGGTAASGPSASEVRDWARANGWQVSDRGRIPAEVREAYAAAH